MENMWNLLSLKTSSTCCSTTSFSTVMIKNSSYPENPGIILFQAFMFGVCGALWLTWCLLQFLFFVYKNDGASKVFVGGPSNLSVVKVYTKMQ